MQEFGGQGGLANSADPVHQDPGLTVVTQDGQQAAQFGAAADELTNSTHHHAPIQHRFRHDLYLADAEGSVEQRQRRPSQEQGRGRPLWPHGERIVLRQLPTSCFQGAAGVGQRGQGIGVLHTRQRLVCLCGQFGGVVVGDGFRHRQHRRHAARQQFTRQTGSSAPLRPRIFCFWGFDVAVRRLCLLRGLLLRRLRGGSGGAGCGAAGQYHQWHGPAGGQTFRQEPLRIDLVGPTPLVLEEQPSGSGVAGQVQDVEPLLLQGGTDLGQTAPVQHPHIRTLPGPRRAGRVQDPAQLPLVIQQLAPTRLRAGHHRQDPQRPRNLHRHRSFLPRDRAVQLHLLRQHQRSGPRHGQGLPRQVHPPRVVHCQPDPQRLMTRPDRLLLAGQGCRHLTAGEPLTQRHTHRRQRRRRPSRSRYLLRRQQMPRDLTVGGPVTRPLQQPQLLLEFVIHAARLARHLTSRGGERHLRGADP